MSDLEAVRQRWIDAKQEHVFQFWQQLSADDKQRLVSQCELVDLDEIGTLQQQQQHEPPTTASHADEFQPLSNIIDISTATGNSNDDIEADKTRKRDIGMQHIRDNKVAVLLLAGGQGTRLGSLVPKGLFGTWLLAIPSGTSLCNCSIACQPLV
jgi:UDP-N-acetylglucosamine/UDP-N-acetylgalactosamine diphosphorylase